MKYELVLVFYFSFVSEKMGGPIERGQLSNFGWELPLSQVKYELKSNIIPLGKIKSGIHVHRALLFKVGFCFKFEILGLSKPIYMY